MQLIAACCRCPDYKNRSAETRNRPESCFATSLLIARRSCSQSEILAGETPPSNAPKCRCVHPCASRRPFRQAPAVKRLAICCESPVAAQSTRTSSSEAGRIHWAYFARNPLSNLAGMSGRKRISIGSSLVTPCVVDLEDERLAFPPPTRNPLMVVREVAMEAIFELAIVSPLVRSRRTRCCQDLRQELELDLHLRRHFRNVLDHLLGHLDLPIHNILHFGVYPQIASRQSQRDPRTSSGQALRRLSTAWLCKNGTVPME